MRDKTWECWLHRCFRQKREASAAPARIYHSNKECSLVTLITHSSQKKTCGDALTHTEIESRPKNFKRVVFRKRKNVRRASRGLGILLNYEQMRQPEDKRQPCQNSVKRNIIRDYFLRSKGIRSRPKHDLTWVCKDFFLKKEQVQTWRSANQTADSFSSRGTPPGEVCEISQESQSAVDRLTFQIQESQDEVDSERFQRFPWTWDGK